MKNIGVYVLLVVIGGVIGASALIYYMSDPLTLVPMETRGLEVRQMTFGLGNGNGTITVSLTSSGTCDVTVSLVKVNGNAVDLDDWTMSAAPVPAGEPATLNISNQTIVSGNTYAVNIFTADGTMVGSYTDTA